MPKKKQIIKPLGIPFKQAVKKVMAYKLKKQAVGKPKPQKKKVAGKKTKSKPKT